RRGSGPPQRSRIAGALADRARRKTACRAHRRRARRPARPPQGTRRARTGSLSQPHGSRAIAPGGASIRAEAASAPLFAAAPQPFLHESGMKSMPRPFPLREHAESAVVHIEKPIYGGAFLSRIQGKAVFVPMALPGEEARVNITQEKRGYASAEIGEIIARSE